VEGRFAVRLDPLIVFERDGLPLFVVKATTIPNWCDHRFDNHALILGPVDG
jgi:hypothetical protein